jgi:hypothetical protein
MSETSCLGSVAVVEVRDSRGNLKRSVTSKKTIARMMRRVQIFDKKGRLKLDTGDVPSHSYTINFLKLLEGRLRSYYTYAGGGHGVYPTISAKDINNVSRNLNMYGVYRDRSRYLQWAVNGEDGSTAKGIVVGTDDTAENNNDYHLVALIASGVGAGQLDYGPMSYVYPQVNGGYCDLVLIRSFYNGSGDSVTVKEFGCYAVNHSYTFMMMRDVEGSGKTVANGDTMVVQYTLRIGAGFTINLWKGLMSLFFDMSTMASCTDGDEHECLPDTDSADMAEKGYQFMGANPDQTNDTYALGVVVGSGSGAESFYDHVLGTPLTSSDLSFLTANWTTSAEVSGNVDCVCSRSFYNHTGVTKNIAEVAIYALTGQTYKICIVRDVLAGAVAVDPGDTATVQYTLRTNVAT